jgi:cellulose synthase/poly-beta-1,6-N-acetylglucosamine synthase-like glycosyltransferase
MSVSPAMVIHRPRTILQKIQETEYLLGLFLRKSFASLNAIHITPGAFSAYKKSFFDKYGGFDVGNITEDLEMALRIQYKGYIIENCPEAPAYTIAPADFKTLLKQRRRWYAGLMRNMWNYRKIISPKYGDMGMFVIPIAWISIFLSVFFMVYYFFKIIWESYQQVVFWNKINFDLSYLFEISKYTIERIVFLALSNPILIFLGFFAIVLALYILYAIKKVGKNTNLVTSIPLYFAFFAILFGFWWVVSIIYVAFNRKVTWR